MSNYLGFDPTDHPEYFFVSYNNEDADRVGFLAKAMSDAGIPLWYDYGIEYGQQWRIQINERLSRAQSLLLFFTRGILQKEDSYVQKEFEIARILNKKIIVLMFDEIQNSEIPISKLDWWVDIRNNQCLCLYRMPDTHKMLEEVKRALGYKERPVIQLFSEMGNDSGRFQGSTDVKSIFDDPENRYSDRQLLRKGKIATLEKAWDTVREVPVMIKQVFDQIDRPNVPYLNDRKLAAELKSVALSSGLCPVYEINPDKGYMIMPYLENSPTVGSLLANEIKVLSVTDGLDIVRSVLRGLQTLHQKDILHGDVSPDNVLAVNGTGVLVDYDMTTYNNRKINYEFTHTLAEYQSPEKLMGESIDCRSDIFEAGMLLDRVTMKIVRAGRLDFSMLKIVNPSKAGRGPVPTEYREGRCELATEKEQKLIRVIKKATNERPKARYQSAAEMLNDLEAVGM